MDFLVSLVGRTLLNLKTFLDGTEMMEDSLYEGQMCYIPEEVKEDKNFITVVSEEPEGTTAQVVVPIICEGDAIGAVVILGREPRTRFGDTEVKLAATAAGFLGRQMEGQLEPGEKSI